MNPLLTNAAYTWGWGIFFLTLGLLVIAAGAWPIHRQWKRDQAIERRPRGVSDIDVAEYMRGQR